MIDYSFVVDRYQGPRAQARTADGGDGSDEVRAEEDSQVPEVYPGSAPALAYRSVDDFDSYPGTFARYVAPMVRDPAVLEPGAVEAIQLLGAVVEPGG
jgi:hypothetical protein